MSFESERSDKARRVEEMIRRQLPEEKGYQRTVSEAMNYSMLAGGKRLRPLMMYETFRMYAGSGNGQGRNAGTGDGQGGRTGVTRAGDEDDRLIGLFMAAIEMIHTYSLVHDDLPAMDNDEYRRGRKTTHIVYGEAMAILAGDGLLTHAFQTAAGAFALVGEGCDAAVRYKRIGRAIRVLAEKAGVGGMLGGQCVDVEAEKKGETVTMEQLLYIHEKKTAAMIQSSLMIGAILGGAPEEDIARLERIGYHVGIAFQIRDDILDVEGSLEELGKPIGSDAKNQKATYVTLAGMERAKEDVERISHKAVDMMGQLTVRNEFLTEMIRRMVYRKS